MIAIGIAFVVFWALVELFSHIGIAWQIAAIVTGLAFILLGLLFGERSIRTNP